MNSMQTFSVLKYEIQFSDRNFSFRSGNSPFSSQSNIDRERMVREVNKSPQFSEEEGVLRIFIRNRPVSLLCPGRERESFSLDQSLPAPQQRLRLEWVYGYRGRDARCNLQLLPTGTVTFS